MGVYTRFKRDANGFRKLVELLEATPQVRRQKMIDVGMQEDPAYTEKALQYMITFEDILKLPDMELADVIAGVPPRMTAYAISLLTDDIKNRFMKLAHPRSAAEIKDLLQVKIGPREAGGGQSKMIESARAAEKKGLVKAKRIPG